MSYKITEDCKAVEPVKLSTRMRLSWKEKPAM